MQDDYATYLKALIEVRVGLLPHIESRHIQKEVKDIFTLLDLLNKNLLLNIDEKIDKPLDITKVDKFFSKCFQPEAIQFDDGAVGKRISIDTLEDFAGGLKEFLKRGTGDG